MPRIAHFVETLASGGAEKLAVGVAGKLADRGWEAHLIVAQSDGPLLRRLPAAVRLGDLACERKGVGAWHAVAYFSTIRARLERYVRDNRIDVLQCHLPLANFQGLLLAKRRVCRVLPTIHNEREFDYGGRGGNLRKPLRRAAYRQLLVSCPVMVAVSDQARTAMIAALGVDEAAERRITVIPNGVPVLPRATAAERAAARERWGVELGEVLIVGVGRLTAQKNFRTLLEALSAGEIMSARWRCIIAGEGELRQDLERMIVREGLDGRCRLAGHVEDASDLLRAADVFCLPSTFEGMPLAVLEAMAHELPVIASDLEVLAELVRDGVGGRMVAVGDAAALTQALLEVVGDESLRRRWGQAAGTAVRERHDLNMVVDRLEALYGAVTDPDHCEYSGAD